MQKYQNVAQDALGNVIPGMSVSVFAQGTQNLATIYSDNGITITPNPLTTDPLGNFTFYAANGRYDLQLTKTGLPTTQLLDIELFDSANYVPPLASLSAALGADVLLNNTANYFDGPAVAQGNAGTWLVTASLTLVDTAGAAVFLVKLWDGTTVIASGTVEGPFINGTASITLSGVITAPAGNLKISAKDFTSVNGKMLFNNSLNSKDCIITAVRIG